MRAALATKEQGWEQEQDQEQDQEQVSFRTTGWRECLTGAWHTMRQGAPLRGWGMLVSLIAVVMDARNACAAMVSATPSDRGDDCAVAARTTGRRRSEPLIANAGNGEIEAPSSKYTRKVTWHGRELGAGVLLPQFFTWSVTFINFS